MKVGVIGAGAISDIYLKNMIETFDELEVVSICAKHPENAQKKAAAYGIVPEGPISMGGDGAWQFWLVDPDGNRLELMQYSDKALRLRY